MGSNGMELALFDFDHTVTTCDTYGRFLRRVATAEQLAQAWWKVGPWLAAYKLKLISAERIRARVTRLTFSNRHSDDIATLAAGFSREFLPEVVRPEMLEQIRWHREQQHTVVIVSGSLDLYLREISRYPLIPQEEEVALARRIRTGEEEALDKLVRSNLRFVVSVAKKYQNQGVSLSDLINEGNLGLIRAAHKFDETKGIKFISYAVWWIRQAILQALAEQSRIVRVPLNRAGTLHRITRRSSVLLQELGREPTPAEIAEGMDIDMEEVEKTLSISQNHVSLDAPLAPGEDNRLLDYIPDNQNPGPDAETFEHALNQCIEAVLQDLKEREAKILRLYFGLDSPEPMTLEEIGAQLGITRERVRQIKEKALSRLRHVSRSKALESFLS